MITVGNEKLDLNQLTVVVDDKKPLVMSEQIKNIAREALISLLKDDNVKAMAREHVEFQDAAYKRMMEPLKKTLDGLMNKHPQQFIEETVEEIFNLHPHLKEPGNARLLEEELNKRLEKVGLGSKIVDISEVETFEQLKHKLTQDDLARNACQWDGKTDRSEKGGPNAG